MKIRYVWKNKDNICVEGGTYRWAAIPYGRRLLIVIVLKLLPTRNRYQFLTQFHTDDIYIT